MKKKVAIIGGGIAGLTAGYLLNKKYNVSLFERRHQVGGNAYTFRAKNGEYMDIAVAAFARNGYRNFLKLLDAIDVKTSIPLFSLISTHNLDTNDGIYITPLPSGLIKQRFSILRLSKLLSVHYFFRGINDGKELNREGLLAGLSLKQAIDRIPKLRGDSEILFMCLLCLMSSMSADELYAAPADFFFSKLEHYFVPEPGSLRTITNGTKDYVQKLAATFKDGINLNTEVQQVIRKDDQVTLRLKDGSSQQFDFVIFACPADQAYRMLEKPTDLEDELLGKWKFKDGPLVVHSDRSMFPDKDLCQGFTFLYDVKDGKFNTSVNGCIWHQPSVNNKTFMVGAQHPNYPIREELIEHREVFRTPIFDFDSVPTIDELPRLNGKQNTYYCGSYFGYGLHEDAVTSAMNVAALLGAPFKPRRHRWYY